MSRRICFLIAISSFSSYGSADCLSDYKEIIINYYSPGEVRWDESACEAWPATGLSVVATAIEFGEGIDMGVAVIDPKARKIIGSMREVDMLASTAIYNTAISIDTENYRLNSQTFAFGVRTLWQGSSKPNPYGFESLNLYVLNGAGLSKILSDMKVKEKVGEWDTLCEGAFYTRQMTLAVAPSSEEYSDIDVEEEITSTQSKVSAGICTDVSSKAQAELYSIRYVNGLYVVPQKLRSFIQPD